MQKPKIDPDGWASLWIPAVGATVLFALIMLFATLQTNYVAKQIENNVNKRFDQIQPSIVNVPKYDSLTKKQLDTSEARRKMSHSRIDNLPAGELQKSLDSLFNQ